MSNSYIHNEERGFDGESMSDWFTGSGCVLVKALILEIFGLYPDLDGLKVRPANYFPTNEASVQMQIKGCDVSLVYKKAGDGKRRFVVNGKEVPSACDEKAKTQFVYFTNDELKQGTLVIEVID